MKYYSVKKIDTVLVQDHTDDVFVGMKVQSNTNQKPHDIVVILSPEQLSDLYDTMIEKIIDSRTLKNDVKKVD
jgi:hypothetical protein